MANRGYSWSNVKHRSSYQISKSEHLGRMISIAIVLAVLFHVFVIFGLKSMHINFASITEMLDLKTEPIRVTKVEFRESLPEVIPEDLAEPPKVAGELLDEIEALEEIPIDTEIDMSPDITDPKFDVKMEAPALKGSELAESLEPIAGPDFNANLPEIGRTDTIMQPAASGQVLIDPGEQSAEVFDPDKFNDLLERKGADGLADKGALDSFTPLGDMTRMQGNALENAKGMIGSDLLFEFNKAELRESARNSLLKVALLIDRNPGLNCWIEGHTDLIGNDAANGELSLRRAMAVRDWLVESMLIDPKRLIVIGYGERQPLVKEGDQEAQALNRRVVIKMRRGQPAPDDLMFLEGGNTPTSQEPVLVKPTGPPVIPRAQPLPEDEPPVPPRESRAVPVEEPPGRAIPVEPGRAVPVE